MAESTRELAARLATLDDTALAALFAARGVGAQVTWLDFFDAADAFTAEASVARALAGLPAEALTALSEAGDAPVTGPHADALRALVLTDAEGHPRVEVLHALSAVADATPGAQSLPRAADDGASAAAAERAFTSVAAIGDVLIEALHSPLTRVGSGALGAADRRRLADELQRPEDLDALLAIAEAVGLMGVEGRALLPTPEAISWLGEPTPARWAIVARRWRDNLPRGIRAAGAWVDPTGWTTAFPADAGWPDRAGALRAQGEAWGLIATDGSEPPWSAALRDEASTDEPSTAVEDSLATQLPHEVDRIYLQNDLTAISPGPLASALDVRLRGLARRESHAQASTYRFTGESVAAAITEGETAESLLEFLESLSLTGVPQPLEYLVRTTADRHGLIRVGPDPEAPDDAPRTLVSSAEHTALATVAVDQALRPLGLVRTAEGLVSRVERDVVLWALVDARYPAVAVDAHGEVEPLRRHRLADGPVPAQDAREVYAALLATLRGADATDADAAWLGRELEAAVRSRFVIELDVAMPGGETRAFVLEASGLGGGRLRGRERGTDIERTLPVSSIRGVRRL